MAFALTWMKDVLANAGVRLSEVKGWENYGRREMGKIHGVMCHHTAGRRDGNMPSLRTLIQGRMQKNGEFLHGPLANLGLARDGTFILIGAGVANHAGTAGTKWQGQKGNHHFIGIEAESTGVGNDWTAVQLDAYRHGVAALLKHLNIDIGIEGVKCCCGHKEYAPGRKPDPNFDMDKFRADVKTIMEGTQTKWRPVPGRDSNDRGTLARGRAFDPAVLNDLKGKLGIADEEGFGPKTEAAIRIWQRENGLFPDGIFGPKSWRKYDELWPQG